MTKVILGVDFLAHHDYMKTCGHEDNMRYEHVTLDRLKEMLDFNFETGVFTWRKRPYANSKRRPGDRAGNIKPNGYLYIGLDNRSYLANQLAFFYVHGRWACSQVGFVNGNRSDCRPENLVEMRTTTNKHDLGTQEGRARYNRDYWATNSNYRRELGFKRYYGISFEQYQRMHDAQNGLCAICEKPETSSQGGKVRELAVDHCHATGAVRGLLCMNCNSTIGRMGDDPALLERAAAYLRASAAQKEAA